MQRLIAVLLFCVGLLCNGQANAQRSLLLHDPLVLAYIGPLDITPSSFAAFSTRCTSTSYAGNVLDIVDAATGNTTGTRLVCSPGGILSSLVSGSACTFVTGNACSPLLTTCGSCVALNIYDQSGLTNCTVGCTLTQATNAQRVPVSTNCQNGKICLQCDGTALHDYTAILSASLPQPFTVSGVAARTGKFTSFSDIAGEGAGNVQLGFTNAANTALQYAGSVAAPGQTVADSSPHAMQAMFNGASSSLYIDGTNNATSPGAAAPASSDKLAICSGGDPNVMQGNWFEAIWWAGDKSANNAAINNNQHAFWGF